MLHVALADLVAHLLEDARPARHRSVTTVAALPALAVGVVSTAAEDQAEGFVIVRVTARHT
jgi:hypothetical protein